MASIYWVAKKYKREKKKKKRRSPKLDRCPQKKGTCLKVFLMSPRKPNSARRKVVRVILTNEKKTSCFIPGEGLQQLQRHSNILVRGGRVKDLPGVRYKAIRGKYDLVPILRKRARSKYGMKNLKKLK